MVNYQVAKFADEYLSEVILAPIFGKTRDQCYDVALAAFDYPCMEIIKQCRQVLDEILSGTIFGSEISNGTSILPRIAIGDLRKKIEDQGFIDDHQSQLDFILSELMEAQILELYDSDPMFTEARQLQRFQFENEYFVTLASDDDIFVF